MVGIFGGKNSPSRPSRPSTDATTPTNNIPPPPYVENGHRGSVYATETITTTTQVVTTTTQTTTHFFSLPLWRKRTPANSAVELSRPSLHASPSSDELGMIRSSPNAPLVLFRDKDLPPTPSPTDSLDHTPIDTPDTSLALEEVSPAQNTHDRVRPNSATPVIALNVPSNGEPSSQSAIALARAALGLGLQPVMLNHFTASSSSSEVNTVSFMTPPTSAASQDRPSVAAMRRAKSFQKDSSDAGAGPSYAQLMERRRSRGLSLGLLHFGTDTKGKSKERETETDARPSLQKSLTRKASFWRKRNNSQTQSPTALSLSQERTLQPLLPSLQPISPFRVDTSVPSSPSLTPESSNPQLSPELRRRHSDRAPPNEIPPEHEVAVSPERSPTGTRSKRRRPRRPRTADTAESQRRRNSSFFSGSSYPLSSSPPSDIALSISPSSSHSSSNQATVRPRSSTNPPFLQRLSINLFGSPSIPSPQLGSSLSGEQLVDSPTHLGSARPSVSRSKHSLEIPRPRHEEESPEVYLHRLLEAVSKAEIATVLASSPDEFHARALRAYVERFDFSSDPLDVALRKLLMDVGLPKETQQIDRVMEAFASRYLQCHMNLFTSDDHPYVLAFSLIMLHTDAFNKSNKRKMTKADYIKNTRLPGVAPEVLDVRPQHVNGQRGLVPDGTPSRRLSSFSAPSPGGMNGASLLGKSAKIDPYYLITRNLLDDLRVNVEMYVPRNSPYVYQGTAGQWDDDELLRAFQTAGVVEVNSAGYYPAPWFSLGVGGGPGPMAIGGGLPSAFPPSPEAFSLRVTKVGTLWRKDVVLEGGRKPMHRKWKEWSVLLTGSQLLLCRDLTWVNVILAKAERVNGEVNLPHASIPKPDELLSVKDAVAVFDKSYIKYPNVLRLALPDGRHALFQAPDEKQMNEWIARINYASAFKTAGVRMRSLGMSGKDIELTGQAAAASHLRDVQNRNREITSRRGVRTWEGRSSLDIEMSSRSDPVMPAQSASKPAKVRTASVDSDQCTSPMENPSKLLKATFDQVKQDLAAGHWQSMDEISLRSFTRPRAMSLESSLGSPFTSPSKADEIEEPQLSSRSRIIRSKVSELESKISVAQGQLETDMRFVRNIAVLTPFQRATRERLQAAVQAISKRVMQVRLDIEKLVCHRDVLARDLIAEERDWQWTKKMALRAATVSLQIQQQQQQVPRMTLSVFLDDVAEQSLSTSPPQRSTSRRPESSAGESFHSALEYSSDSDDRRDTSFDTSPSLTAPSTPKHAKASLSTVPDSLERRKAAPLTAESSMESSFSNRSDTPERSHQKYVTAPEMPEEEAEEWDKTRAAKRVSLVKLPSDLRMSVLFSKHGQGNGQSVSEESPNPTSPQSERPTQVGSGTEHSQNNSPVETLAVLNV
ncbi:unnamed protein product [Somion occarium]|uniref:Uncharacterized protein n=1 Tax=Somion occarium TaxID=3059160 RepID=A0ABP1CK30_9APHY